MARPAPRHPHRRLHAGGRTDAQEARAAPPIASNRLGPAFSWAAITVAAGALVAACFVHSIEIAIEAFIDAGDAQRGFRYGRELTLALDGGWPGPFAVAAGLALVAAGITGIAAGSKRWLVVASFVVAAALGLLVFDTEDQRLQWAGPGGVIGYESPHGGPLLQPALDDLKAEARATPEARSPGWELAGEDGFSSRGLTGWRVFMWSTLALLWLTGYRLARLAVRPWPAVFLVLGGTAVVFVWIFLRGLSRLG